MSLTEPPSRSASGRTTSQIWTSCANCSPMWTMKPLSGMSPK